MMDQGSSHVEVGPDSCGEEGASPEDIRSQFPRSSTFQTYSHETAGLVLDMVVISEL